MIRYFTLLLALVSFTASANDAAKRLSEKFNTHQRFTALFQQYTLGEGSAREELSNGQLWIEHPNKLRWETQLPFPQIIVGDGENLWIYDPDLEQATRRSLDEDTAFTPASVIGATESELQARFIISEIDAGTAGASSDALFELRPKVIDNAEFERLRLLFNSRGLSEILIEDGLGQRSLIMLSDVKFPSQIPSSRFTFVPPPGTDLIEARAD